MALAAVRRRWCAASGPRVDAAFAGLLTVWHLASWLATTPIVDGGRALVVAAVLCVPTVPLAWRRRWPWPSFLAVASGYVVWLVTVSHELDGHVAMFFVLIALYSLARWSPAPSSLAGAVVAAAVLAVPEAGSAASVVLLAIPAGVWLLGITRRKSQQDATRLRELTEQLRAEQELRAQHAVTTERVRIATDLHDAVAQQVSAIAVVANAMAGAPAEAMAAQAGMIASAADGALVEMRRLIGLLADGGELAPHVSLRELDALVEAAEAVGCTVRLRVAGELGDLPGSVATAAYRVVAEGLANVVKHAGPAAVEIDVARDGTTLSVTVDNGPGTAEHRRVPGTGLGIAGLRDRVALFGGTLAAGPHQGGWRLAAVLRTGRG
ncbi:histidine kinase [Actinomycetes bacterium KLBMP 9759]